MEYLRRRGWVNEKVLPPSERLIPKLLQKGRIERQHQGPNSEIYFRMTDVGFEVLKTPVPVRYPSKASGK
jgi:hypothetical protein